MGIRRAFLSKIVMLAIISTANPAFADHPHVSPMVHSQDQYSHMSYQKMMTHMAQNAYLQSQQKLAEYKQLESAIINSPQTALEKLVELSNQQNSSSDAFIGPNKPVDGSFFHINVKYSNSLSDGQLSTIRMSEGPIGKTMITLVTHEKTKSNPFFLLESLVRLSEVFDISSIKVNEMSLKPGANINHHNFDAFHINMYNLTKALGISSLESKNSYSHHLSTWSRPPSPIESVELRANAAAGSVLSQRMLAENDMKTFQRIKKSFSDFLPINSMNEAQKKSALIEYAQFKGMKIVNNSSFAVMLQSFEDQMDIKNKRILESLNQQAKQTYREQIKAYKDGAPRREEVVQGKSLSDMVKANDRAGVANAMDVMLPWEIMEPSEKVFWRDYVDAIRKPNYEGAPILFRGIDQDEKLQAVTDSKGKVVSGGLFSKRLTAGSGSHLFKLKGLVDTFEKFGTSGVNSNKAISPLNQPHSLTKMMGNHAMNPQGSPFISLTYDLHIAFQFGYGAESKGNLATYLNSNASGGVATLRIDKRRTITNSVSGFAYEIEVLASMLIFPDEVLYLEKGVLYPRDGQMIERITINDYYKNARSIVYEKTGQVLPDNFLAYANEGKKAFVDGFSELEMRLRRVYPNQPITCSKVFN